MPGFLRIRVAGPRRRGTVVFVAGGILEVQPNGVTGAGRAPCGSRGPRPRRGQGQRGIESAPEGGAPPTPPTRMEESPRSKRRSRSLARSTAAIRKLRGKISLAHPLSRARPWLLDPGSVRPAPRRNIATCFEGVQVPAQQGPRVVSFSGTVLIPFVTLASLALTFSLWRFRTAGAATPPRKARQSPGRSPPARTADHAGESVVTGPPSPAARRSPCGVGWM